MKLPLTILILTAQLVQSEPLEELLRLAELNNPVIAAAHQEWQAARQQTFIAGALPDPRISYIYYLEQVQTRTGPQEQKAGISQTFPVFGKRGLRKESAEQAAASLYARYRAVRANTLFQVKQNWIDLAYLSRAISTEQTRLQIFQTLEKTTERMVENGGDARDLLDIRILLAQIEDRLQTQQSRQEPLKAKLNAQLNRDSKTPINIPAHLPVTAIAKQFQHENSPLIHEQQATLARRKTEQQLANRNHVPNITLGLNWIQTGDGGDDPLMAGIALNIPLWASKNRAERTSADLKHSAQKNRLDDTINQLQALLIQQLSRIDNTARRIVLHETELIPSAEQHFELTRTAYENGEAALNELTASEERLIKLRLETHRALVDQILAEAEMERLLGGAE